MKKNRMTALILCLLLALECLALPAYATQTTGSTDPTSQTEPSVPNFQLPADDTFAVEDATVTYGANGPDARYPVHGSGPLLEASAAAILYEVNSGTLVYASNPDMPLSPSSLVKIMTALLAIENGDLTESITASWQTLDTVPTEALVAGLHGGETLTLEQLLYCMMVGSANDAAAVIAVHIAGSQQAFVDMMNQRAQELGCTGTNFVNVHGLHEDGQVTTVRDMVKIMLKALEYPVFQEIFGARNYTLPATNMAAERYFQTTNYLGSDELTDDYYDERVTGGRTGVTDEGHRCLAVTAEVEGTQYISVVLESRSEYADNGVMTRQGSFEDTTILLDLAFEESVTVQVLNEDEIVDQLRVENGTSDVVIGPDTAVYTVLPADYDPAWITTRVRLVSETMSAPVEADVLAGTYQVWYGGVCIAHVPLYTKNSAAVSQQALQQQNPAGEEPGFDAGAITTALAVLGVIFLVVLLLGGGLWLVRKFRGRSRKRKRRQERRRSR